MQLRASSEADLPEIARAVLDFGKESRCYTFSGELGAGKTALIKAICTQLGVQVATSSPTFAIVNEYLTAEAEPVAHMDLYRLNDREEMIDAGLLEYFDDHTYCFIEWPEKFSDLLPLERVSVKIAVDNDTRWIELSK